MNTLDGRRTEYLVFREVSYGGKTRKFNVESARTGVVLARVGWYGPWRQFVMRPEPTTIFNRTCLAEIETFLADAYADWREKKSEEVPHPEGHNGEACECPH